MLKRCEISLITLFLSFWMLIGTLSQIFPGFLRSRDFFPRSPLMTSLTPKVASSSMRWNNNHVNACVINAGGVINQKSGNSNNNLQKKKISSLFRIAFSAVGYRKVTWPMLQKVHFG